MNGVEEFCRQLIELEYQPEVLQPDRVVFDYTIQEGRHANRHIKLGFIVPPDFPLTPPGGPNLSPRILAMNASAPGHPERVADSPLGPEWQYLSRPYPNWKSKIGAHGYMGHVAILLHTL